MRVDRPALPDGSQQQLLDVWADDLAAAHDTAVDLGATVLKPADDPETTGEVGPVYTDPGGQGLGLICLLHDHG